MLTPHTSKLLQTCVLVAGPMKFHFMPLDLTEVFLSSVWDGIWWDKPALSTELYNDICSNYTNYTTN